MKEKLLKISAVIIFIELPIHFFGVFGLWYLKFWWLDLVTHFIGGFWLSLTFVWFWFFSGYIKNSINFWKIIIFGLFSVFITALFWEVFEYSLDLRYSPDGYWFDTRLDIIIGTCGGFLSSVITAYLWKKNSN